MGLVLDRVDVFRLHGLAGQILLNLLFERGKVAAEMFDEARVGPTGERLRRRVEQAQRRMVIGRIVGAANDEDGRVRARDGCQN